MKCESAGCRIAEGELFFSLQGIIRRGMDDYHSCSFLEGRFFSVSSGSLVINVDSWRLRLALWLLIVRHGGVYVIVCTICPHHIIPQCKLIHSNIRMIMYVCVHIYTCIYNYIYIHMYFVIYTYRSNLILIIYIYTHRHKVYILYTYMYVHVYIYIYPP